MTLNKGPVPQNPPVRTPEGRRVRDLFREPVVVHVDYAQMERLSLERWEDDAPDDTDCRINDTDKKRKSP